MPDGPRPVRMLDGPLMAPEPDGSTELPGGWYANQLESAGLELSKG